MSICDALRMFALATAGAVTAVGAISTRVSAQPAEDQAAARALFNEARDLMRDGRYDQACPKLEAASRLYRGSGILLNLGDCYERTGRTASAWTEFGESASVAARLGSTVDRDEAQRRQGAIEPKLCRLSIGVAKPAPGLVVKRDGAPIDAGAWGAAIPVDPGAHAVSAEAPGYVAWSASADVSEAGKTVTVEVPGLAPAPAPPASTSAAPALSPLPPAPPQSSSPAAAEPRHYWTGRRVAGAAISGAGIVAIGAAGVLSLAAKSQYDKATGETGNARHDDSVTAGSTADDATVAVVVGAVATAAGLVVWLTAPDAPVRIGVGGKGIVVGGSF